MGTTETEKNAAVILDAAKKKECETIINKWAKSAALTGAALTGGTDILPFTYIQMKMIQSIGKILNIEISKEYSKKLFKIIWPSIFNKTISDNLFIGSIPIIGSIRGSSKASNATKAIGWTVVGHFCDINMEYLQKNSFLPKSRINGIEEGYVLASLQYEEKFLDQAKKIDEELENRDRDVRNETVNNNLKVLRDESLRVANLAGNSRKILDDLDREFEKKTGLDKKDAFILFWATGLQIARWIIINKITAVEKAGKGNLKESNLHNLQDLLLKRFNNGIIINESPYYASLNHIVSRHGVPYDATRFLTESAIEQLKMKGNSWNIDIDKYITQKLPLFNGANHRFSTLGHDPIFGLLFGTGNIMTNTISCVDKPLIKCGIGIPVVTTNHVIYTSDYKHPVIGSYASTAKMLGNAAKRTVNEPSAFVAALIKQIIHIGTDMYTPCGIQIPAANLVLSNSNVEKITRYISTGDIIKIGASAKISELINTLISTIHLLFYKPDKFPSQEVYAVKTKKIIMYSNVISSSSNIIWTGLNVAAGNKTAIKNLDIGGLIVTINRLIKDIDFIYEVKREFIFGKFDSMIKGNLYETTN